HTHTHTHTHTHPVALHHPMPTRPHMSPCIPHTAQYLTSAVSPMFLVSHLPHCVNPPVGSMLSSITQENECLHQNYLMLMPPSKLFVSLVVRVWKAPGKSTR